MLKIKLLLELINLLVSDTQSLEEDQLSKHWTQLLKLRNDEYQAEVAAANLKRKPPPPPAIQTENKMKLSKKSPQFVLEEGK